MCDRCAALEDELIYLRYRLGDRLNLDLLRIVMAAFDLSPSEARLVVVLYQARAIVPFFDLEEAIKLDPSSDYASMSNTVHVLLSRTRRKTRFDFIDTFKGQGLWLSGTGRQAVAAAIADDVKTAPVPVFPDNPEDRVTLTWNKQRRRELHRLLRVEGKSYSEAAVALHVTRGAVASVAKRFGYQAEASSL